MADFNNSYVEIEQRDCKAGNTDLARRAEAVQREAALSGAKMTYSEARQIVLLEEQLDSLERLGKKTFSETPQDVLKAAIGMRGGHMPVNPESVARFIAIERVQLAAAKRGTKLTYAEAREIAGS